MTVETSISASVGQTVNLTFAPGHCSLKSLSKTWSIMKKDQEVFSSYNNYDLPNSTRCRFDCPRNRENSLQIDSVELSDQGTYCLHTNEGICSCVHLKIKIVSSEDTSIQTNSSAPDDWIPSVVSACVLCAVLIGGLAILSKKKKGKGDLREKEGHGNIPPDELCEGTHRGGTHDGERGL